ncbi:Nrap protein [Pseudomassariella vexata]|uniref:U3 small nucleolar RNA-associated protein 22 n=1 Tax=Pseudomassariella vexata TaxID=1141098 RepID=A0A1Y2DNN1_9PEZI|nr:Nrap protein [Pseudomassariella vexata]ORY60882.1 Nrap protein [Pseudomassariella vexata]
MESSVAKRRKLGHSGVFPFPNGTSSSSGASAFVEAAGELLKDVKLDYAKTFDGVDEILRQFKDTIEAIEPHESLPIGDASTKFEKANRIPIPYPSPRPNKNSNYKLSIAKPAQVNVVGSYQLKTMIKSQTGLAIDMIVVMPAQLFQDKDYLNCRYFYKRSYYLANIAACMRKSFGTTMEFTFEGLHGNNLLPVLVARPKGEASYAIRVIPCAPEDIFPSAKLLPTTNAVRQGADAESKSAPKPTPFYNATLRAESQYTAYLRLLNSTAKSCGAFKDACILGRIWLQQRGFGGSISEGGFGHFEFAVLVALLLQGGSRKGEPVLSPSLNSTQLFKATVQFLAGTNFQKKHLLIIGPLPSDPSTIRQNNPTLYDSARELNILWKMAPWSANLLQQQAKWSLNASKDNTFDQFDSEFIVKVDQPLQMYDLLLKVELPSTTEFLDMSNYRGLGWDFSEKLYQVLKKALGDRVELVSITMPKSTALPISASKTTTPTSSSLLVGLILKPETVNRRIDHGPSAEEKEESSRFRNFWGDEKAELRRFQDGSILECLEWEKDSTVSIPEQIIRYISKRHLKINDDSLEFYADDFAPIARIGSSDAQNFLAARRALESLEREIRDLRDLPLHVRQIVGTCPELRYTSSQPPLTAKGPPQPMDIVISFEASGKWADNLAAIQRLKIAFLLKIGSSLEESNESIKTHLGLDNADRDTQNLAFLDIVYDTGFAFRLRVQSDAEENELEKVIKDKTRERHVQAEAAELLAISTRLYTYLPLHNQAVATYCMRFATLSASIRLVKHWFNSHKLSCHFNEELVELFVLQAFLKSYPWQTPSSASTGFLRTLHLLSRWEWNEEPMIVDTSDSLEPMTSSDRSAILARYNECRRLDPRLNRNVLFVATSYAQSGTVFTGQGPSRVVANQMTKLARAACELVKAKGAELDPRSLFQSSLRHYDVVIRLDPKVVKALLRDDGIKHSHFKNLDPQTGRPSLPLAERPVKALLRQLNAMYSPALVFFHGGKDDPVIAGLWNQELASHPRTSRVNLPCSFKPIKGDDASLELDRQAMLAEIARIGGDLIEEIDVKDGN